MDQSQHEKEELIKAAYEAKDMLNKSRAECESLAGIVEDYKSHYQAKEQDCEILERKCRDMKIKIQEIDDQSRADMMHMRHLLDMKKRELEDREAQFSQAIDPEIMRMKLKKDIEAPLKIELEAKQREMLSI